MFRQHNSDTFHVFVKCLGVQIDGSNWKNLGEMFYQDIFLRTPLTEDKVSLIKTNIHHFGFGWVYMAFVFKSNMSNMHFVIVADYVLRLITSPTYDYF